MHLHLFSDELHRGVGFVGHLGLQVLLNCLNLLRHRGQSSLLQPVELVEAAPGAHLAQSNEDPPHGLEVEGLVAVEDEDKPAELIAERLDGLGLARAGRPERRPAQVGGERLRP